MHDEHRAELQQLFEDATSRRNPIDVECLMRAATEAVAKNAAAPAPAVGQAAGAGGALALYRDRLHMEDVLGFVRRTAGADSKVEVHFDGKEFVFKYRYKYQPLPQPVAS